MKKDDPLRLPTQGELSEGLRNRIDRLEAELKAARAAMNAPRYSTYLDDSPLVSALWWFIENVNEDDAQRTETFFYLRERVRSGI